MKLREQIDAGRFVVTGEVGPPKGTDLDELIGTAKNLIPFVDAVNVTDMQSATMYLGSLATCNIFKENGIEPVYQLTCRDRNRIALQSDLLSAVTLGIENVLILTGDHPRIGDHPQAKPVYDVDSVQLLQIASNLHEGVDMVGNELNGKFDMCLGAVVRPVAEPLEPQIIKLEKKVKAGAQFIQTQGVFDTRQFETFMKAAEHINVPILVGIILLKSDRMARFMNANVAGVEVPEPLIEEMASAKLKSKVSVQIAGRLINEMRDMCQGVHIMSLGWERRVPEVLAAAGLCELPEKPKKKKKKAAKKKPTEREV